MEIIIDDKKAEKIQKYVDKKSFESVEAFVDRALTLLIYAEDNRDMFQQMIKQQETEHKE